MKLSPEDVVLLCLFVHDVTSSISFTKHDLKSQYRQAVLDLENRLIAQRNRNWQKTVKNFKMFEMKRKRRIIKA